MGGKLVSYFLNNAAKTCLYGLKISENIEIGHFFQSRTFFISVTIFTQVASVPLKGFTETAQNEVKEQKGEFFSMLSGTLGASLLGNILTGRGVNRAAKSQGQGINRAGERVLKAGFGNNKEDF